MGTQHLGRLDQRTSIETRQLRPRGCNDLSVQLAERSPTTTPDCQTSTIPQRSGRADTWVEMSEPGFPSELERAEAVHLAGFNEEYGRGSA